MIKLEKTSVMNFENAIRGARNPMNSWEKSDSFYTCSHSGYSCADCIDYVDCQRNAHYHIGPNDLKLAQKLCKAGSDHRKFIRQIFVSVDITAPLYWWKEADTYKVGTVANSTSTMHKIQAKEFTRDDFSHDHMSDVAIACLDATIACLEDRRQKFLATKDKSYWYDIIQLLPSSYNQMRTVTMNYETLLNQYHARKHHKLDEWHTYCDWIETLPYFKEICLEDEVDGK